jgi:4-alpha-glucanotransferase
MISYGQQYEKFLESKTAKHWKRFGVNRRAGVLAPLFSVYSKESIGIGEIPDIKKLTDWCVKTGLSIIQLLPMNDTGFNFTPYDCQSTFALEPMYLRLSDIKGIDAARYSGAVKDLKEKFGAVKKRVNYKIKEAKLEILWNMFSELKSFPVEFEAFCTGNVFWLDDYAVYKVLKEKNFQKSWTDWEEKYRFREGDAVALFTRQNESMVDFYKWLQWQIFEQFTAVKKYANSKNVFIQGDLPFLVSRDSADVWAHQNYFKLNLSSGAPTDMYFAKGQRWGMPPYNWELIEEHGFDYLVEKVKYAENFMDMFRIDHFVGLFRLWTIKLDEPENTFGLNGRFDPQNEGLWKEHGQKILKAMTDNSIMLPCAEDLGVVPACSYETLEEFGIPGMDVQRWTRDWGNTYNFKETHTYRYNASAIISSHDTSPLITWWENECGTVDAMLVEKMCGENGFEFSFVSKTLFRPFTHGASRIRFKAEIETSDDVLKALNTGRDRAWMFYDLHRESANEQIQFWKYIGLTGTPEKKADTEFVNAALMTINETRSVFSIQLLQDWLSLGNYFDKWDKLDLRVNTPGTVTEKNWSIVMPLSLEELLESKINGVIAGIVKATQRS